MTAVLVLLSLSLVADVYQETVVTRNPDPNWEPQTYEEWLAGEPGFVPLQVTEIIPGADADVELLILLEEGLADSVGMVLLNQWAADITSQGLTPEILEITYSTPEELRDYLSSRLSDGLEGAVLLGDLPVAWCALDEPGWEMQEQFPSDYFFMDLDGLWEDLWIGYPSAGNPGQDGKYDTWSGELCPEIYVGRIRPSALSSIADPVEMIQLYLQRNHEWRLNGDPEPLHALCYVDDDWAAFGINYQYSMSLLYPDVELVNELLETNGTDYRDNRLPGNYVWISPYVHSSPTLHAWEPGPNTYWNDIVPANPPSRFYNLFACSNARFTTPRNMGSIYALATSSGLGSVGSAKTGSMLQFTHFYLPLGQGSSLGEAYAQWWNFIAQNGLTQDEKAWHLGMALIGDPTLLPAMHLLGIEGGAPFPGAVPVLSVSPNPASGTVRLRAEGLEGESAGISVFDIAGRLVRQSEMPPDGNLALDISDLGTGIYLVRMTSCTGSSTTRTLVRVR